jgi:magnesium transporter
MKPLPPPKRPQSSDAAARDDGSSQPRPPATPLPGNLAATGDIETSGVVAGGPSEGRKKRKHRGGKKKRNRRQSFAAPSETSTMPDIHEGRPMGDPLRDLPAISAGGSTSKPPPYRRGHGGRTFDEDNYDSDALLDHRDQPHTLRSRRDSRAGQMTPASYRTGMSSSFRRMDHSSEQSRRAGFGATQHEYSDADEDDDPHDRTPLISGTAQHKDPVDTGYGLFKGSTDGRRKRDTDSTKSQTSLRVALTRNSTNEFPGFDQGYDVNNPPSVPTSPQMHGEHSYDDVMIHGGDFLTRSADSRRNLRAAKGDTLIDIDGDGDVKATSAPHSPRLNADGQQRRKTINLTASGDVCFPSEAMSEMGDEDFEHDRQRFANGSRRRNRRRGWPELWVLDEWSREEKEERLDGVRAKRINEPVLVDGRLRPSKGNWHHAEDDVPFRYTYFNEEFESTIHALTISELVPAGGSFRQLFIPDPPVLSDSETEEEEEESTLEMTRTRNDVNLLSPKSNVGPDAQNNGSRLNSMLSDIGPTSKPQSRSASAHGSGQASGSGAATPQRDQSQKPKDKKYGPRPTFWLDVMCPTDQEMRVLCKAFGIHALTSEDIMMQEAREKVELFRHYYFINYRTFEQDTNSEDYLEPVNMYVCVFRHGIISFHFSQIPHPANVRRRIRQLTDYLILSSDWISYAIIDDITDVYQPLIHAIEAEVDEIDDQILTLFQATEVLNTANNDADNEKGSEKGDSASTGFDMLRRIGDSRKKVMSLYRLLGNKADVIKGFAKRCNEQWEVAPRSEIGLYLGDIQDHILTMTSNLSHYETLLSRAHSNYLAQINIRMNERAEQTADVLGKLTVVGTIVLPMNIICGMWGMNVKVPGQDIDSLYWFWGSECFCFLFFSVLILC